MARVEAGVLSGQRKGLMFESFEEEQRRSGFRGFVNRHFGPVIHVDLAEDGIRQIGLVFMVLAALSGVVGVVISGNPSPCWAR